MTDTDTEIEHPIIERWKGFGTVIMFGVTTLVRDQRTDQVCWCVCHAFTTRNNKPIGQGFNKGLSC